MGIERAPGDTSAVRLRSQAPAAARSAVPVPPEAAAVLALQRAVGNRATTALLARAGAAAHPAPAVQRKWSGDVQTAEGFNYTPLVTGVPEARERVKTVSANVGTAVARGLGPDLPLSMHSPTGAADADLPGKDRGHVFALELGGSNIRGNVVPMGAGFNRVVWRETERLVRKSYNASRKRRGPKPVISLSITADYAGPDPRVPTSLAVVAAANPATVKGLPINKVVPVAPPVPRTDMTTATAAAAGVTQAATNYATAAKSVLGSVPGAAYAAWAKWMGKAFPVTPGPYAALDFHVGYMGVGKSTTAFTTSQRELILNANRHAHGGVLKSDDPSDPHQTLNEGEDDNAPNARVEIDHIVPKSNGGGNFFANARAISWELNNKVARVKGTKKLLDPMKRGTGTTRSAAKTSPMTRGVVAAALALKDRHINPAHILKYLNANSSTGETYTKAAVAKGLSAAAAAGLLVKKPGGYFLK